MAPKSCLAGRKGERRKYTTRGSGAVSGAGIHAVGPKEELSIPAMRVNSLSGVGGAFPVSPYGNVSVDPRIGGMGDGPRVLAASFQENVLSPASKMELQRLYECREALEQRLLEQDVNVYFAESMFYRVCCELGGSLFSDGPGMFPSCWLCSMSGNFSLGSSGEGDALGGGFLASNSSRSRTARTTEGMPDGNANSGTTGGGGLVSPTSGVPLRSLGIPSPLPSASLEMRGLGGGSGEAGRMAGREVNDPSYLYQESIASLNSLQESDGAYSPSCASAGRSASCNLAAAAQGKKTSSTKKQLLHEEKNSGRNIHPHFLHKCHAYNARLHQFSPAERFFSSSSIGAIGRVEGFLSKAAASGYRSTTVQDEMMNKGMGRGRRGSKRVNGAVERGEGKEDHRSPMCFDIADASSPGVTSVESISSAFSPSLPFALPHATTTLGSWSGGGAPLGGVEHSGCGSSRTHTTSTAYGLGSRDPAITSSAGGSSASKSMTTNTTSPSGGPNTMGGGGFGVHYPQGGTPSSFSSAVKHVGTPCTTTANSTALTPSTGGQPMTTPHHGGTSSSLTASSGEGRSKPSNIDERTGKRRYRRRIALASPISTSSAAGATNDTEDDRDDEVSSTTRGRRRSGRDPVGRDGEEEAKVRETRKYTKRART